MTADASVHFALGMAVGSAIGLPPLLRDWAHYRPLSGGFGKWLLLSYGIGLYAIAPSVLRKLGLPEAFSAHLLMNIFLLHPLIDRLRPGGKLVGGGLITAMATAQYGLLLLAIHGQKRRSA